MDRRLDRRLRTSRPARLLGEDLGRRRRLLELVEALDLFARQGELDAALGDRADLLRRDVARPAEQPGRDREPVEDVVARVADDLVHGADLLSVGVDDPPTGLDHEPGDGIVAHTARPPTYQTGPCVATGYESETARRISTRPVIPSSSQRWRQRDAISGETP